MQFRYKEKGSLKTYIKRKSEKSHYEGKDPTASLYESHTNILTLTQKIRIENLAEERVCTKSWKKRKYENLYSLVKKLYRKIGEKKEDEVCAPYWKTAEKRFLRKG